MRAVADAVGVRPPSLYKRVADRSALLTAVADLSRQSWATRPRHPLTSRTHDARCARWPTGIAPSPMGRRVHTSCCSALAGIQPSPSANAQAAAGVLQVCEVLVGPGQALDAARSLVAYVHGFLSMEIGGAFRLGGDVDAAFAYGIDTYLAGLVAPESLQVARD